MLGLQRKVIKMSGTPREERVRSSRECEREKENRVELNRNSSSRSAGTRVVNVLRATLDRHGS